MPDQIPEKKKIAASTQKFLPIKEIKEGVVVMNNGSLRAVILVSSVNFSLKSDQEKDAMVVSYQNFLNSLHFPIQISTRSRQLHLDDYLEKLSKSAEQQDNELLRAQTAQYVQFVVGLLESANVMEKRFFVIVPYYPTELEKVNVFKKLFYSTPNPGDTDFETQKSALMERVDQTISGLSSAGLRCAALNTEELIELYYTVYNPDVASSEKLPDINDLKAPIISANNETGGSNVR